MVTDTLRIVGPVLRHSSTPTKAKVGRVRPTVNTAIAGRRYDPGFVEALANSLIAGTAIQTVVSRVRGGPVDVYFVATDREAGYRAAAPIIRELLKSSDLALDFHFLSPDELDAEP
jgi:hypothetical protein